MRSIINVIIAFLVGLKGLVNFLSRLKKMEMMIFSMQNCQNYFILFMDMLNFNSLFNAHTTKTYQDRDLNQNEWRIWILTILNNFSLILTNISISVNLRQANKKIKVGNNFTNLFSPLLSTSKHNKKKPCQHANILMNPVYTNPQAPLWSICRTLLLIPIFLYNPLISILPFCFSLQLRVTFVNPREMSLA